MTALRPAAASHPASVPRRDVRAAFFDVDGTLLSFETHAMPASTHETILRLRDRGILSFVATGRVRKELHGLFDDGLFDGFVTLNGQCCFDERGTFRRATLNRDDVARVVDLARTGVMNVLVMTEESNFVTGRDDRVRAVEERVNLHYAIDEPERALEEDVYQFCAFLRPGEEHLLLDHTEHLKTARWTNEFCDVIPDDGGKPVGCRVALERHGLALDQAIAFGDGGNDISMLDACGLAVAMGNAGDDVKAHASYVTADVDHDGILLACEHYDLI